MQQYQIRQFDKIKLRTTKNIRYVSAQPGEMPNPQGLWHVVGNLGKDLIISKSGALCRVPVSDVYLAGRSKADHILEAINGEATKRKRRKEGGAVQKQRGNDRSNK